jgi:hypothetical protein
MTRADIFAQVLSDINREDKADLLPGWLVSAESRINLALRDERMVKHAILPIEDYVFPLPADFLEHKSIELRQGVDGPVAPGARLGPLKYIPSDQLDQGKAELPYPGVRPAWFTVRGKQIEIGAWNKPIVAGAAGFQIDMWYYAKLAALVVDESSNWFSDDFPHIYQDMIKFFAYRNLQEYDTADKHLAMATTEIGIINDASKKMQQGSGPLIMRPARRIGGRYS